MSEVPRIVSAAMLMKDGLIVPGVRHFSTDMRAVLKRIYWDGYHLQVMEQGFIDASGAFLDRSDARAIASAHNQVLYRCGGDAAELFSENLY